MGEVISITANVLGGVHTGEGKTAEERLLARANAELTIGGIPAAIAALRPIGRVIVRALKPLRDEVRQSLPGATG